MRDKVLILGNGVAGFTAAAALREQNSECEIVMMTAEGERFYDRMLLSKALGDDTMMDRIYVKDDGWYEENRVFNMLHCRVVSISTDPKYVEYEDVCEANRACAAGKQEAKARKTETYDILIYALGSRAFVPAIPGVEQRGVTALHTIADALRAQEQLKKANQVLVIGGGILGLEAAWQCRHAGKEVAIVEGTNRLMRKQLDAEGSEFLQHLLQDKHIAVHLGKTVMEIVTDVKKAAICGALIADSVVAQETHDLAQVTESAARQQTIPADMVVLACGVVPNTSLAMQSGLGVGYGVIVDDSMRTTSPYVYACGDCAQQKGNREIHGLWAEARSMGETAGRNVAAVLAGKPQTAVYRQGKGAFYYRGLDTSIFSIGQVNREEQGLNDWEIRRGIEHEQYRDASAGKYEKYYFHNEEMTGAILIGVPEKIGEITAKIGVRRTPGRMGYQS